jgi:hypothetical protein
MLLIDASGDAFFYAVLFCAFPLEVVELSVSFDVCFMDTFSYSI